MSSAGGRLQRIGIAIGIALAAAAMQGFRLPAILGGPGLQVVIGKASDPHLVAAVMDGIILKRCALSAACVHHWNLAIFGIAIFAIGALLSRRPLGLIATTILAASPLAAALVVDPLGSGSSIGIFLTALAATDVTRIRRFPTGARCALAIGLALIDPSLVPAALAYGAFSGRIPLIGALVASAFRFFLQHPEVDPLAGPATLVAFGLCLFIGGPLLMLAVRYRAFRGLVDDGRALLRAVAFALAALGGGILSTSGDAAFSWLTGEAIILVGLVASVRVGRSAAAFWTPALPFSAALGVQLLLLFQYHAAITTVAIGNRSDDLRGMLASSPKSACVASDAIADRYILAGGALLHVYPPRTIPDLSRDVLNCLAMPDATIVITMTGLSVNDWGAAIPLMKAYRDAAGAAGVLRTEGGTVTPATPANTPTHRGSFGNEIDSPLGRVGDFTIVSGYTYTPPCIPIAPGRHLIFSAASIPGTPALHVRIVATSAGARRALFDAVFPASVRNEPYRWIRYALPVDASDCTSFAFSVEGTPPGAGNWLTFAGAVIQ